MVDVACWAQLCKLAFCGLKWILIGDFNQYQPINDRWCGQPLANKSFEHSSLLHTMAGGNSCRLTHNHRSDQRLFDFCGSLCPGGSRRWPIKEMVAAARAAVPSDKAQGRHQPLHLTRETQEAQQGEQLEGRALPKSAPE